MASGNTKVEAKVLENKFKTRSWVFTLNNYVGSDISDILLYLDKATYVFQEEIGDLGTKHLQGCFRFKSQRSFSSVKKSIPRAHLEKCKHWRSSIDYCSKDDTRNGKVWHSKDVKLKKVLIDPIKGKTLHKWQKDILEILEGDPDDRTIHWYWEETGCVGKTTLAKHICMKYNAIYLGGKSKDCKFGVSQFLEKNNGNLDVVIFGLSRSLEQYVSYEALESVKDGIFFNGKYESGMCIFNSPHVIVFANFEPTRSKLSTDRWNIVMIEPDYRSQPFTSSLS